MRHLLAALGMPGPPFLDHRGDAASPSRKCSEITSVLVFVRAGARAILYSVSSVGLPAINKTNKKRQVKNLCILVTY